jgi:uncharacterized protein
MIDWAKIEGFDWDQGNVDKNWLKHKVTTQECEQIFFNKPFLVSPNLEHSQDEIRFRALGRTHNNRLLFIAFTVRKNLIRVISVRDMNRKEKKQYEQTT